MKISLAALGTMAFSALGVMDKMPLAIIVFVFCFVFCAVACYYFRFEFSQRIDELTFLFLNGIAGFVLAYYIWKFQVWSMAAWLVVAIFIINQALVIVQKTFSARRRAYFYVFYLLLMLVLTIVQINKAVFLVLLGDVSIDFKPVEVLVSGMIYVNLWMSINLLLPLLPVTTKDKSETQRLKEVKQHALDLSQHFSDKIYNFWEKGLITIGLVILLWLLLENNIINLQTLIAGVLIIVGLLTLKSDNKLAGTVANSQI